MFSSIYGFPLRQGEDDFTQLAKKAGCVLLIIALVMGVALRLRMYLMDRSLWLDTAILANNVIDKSYVDLFGLLDGSQSAPIGFLLVSKLVGSAFGYSELSLTLLPFIFGVSALMLYLCLCVEVLGQPFAPLAFVPFALSSTAIYYSGEFKQYSSDLFFSVLILYVTHRVLKEQFSRNWLGIFILMGLVSVWFSHTSIFMLAGTGLALFIDAFKFKKIDLFRGLTIACAIISVHFTLLYLLIIKPATPSNMFTYWSFGFPPLSALSSTIEWCLENLFGYAIYPLGFPGYGIIFPLAALGIGIISSCLIKYWRSESNLFTFPLIFLLFSSVFHLYPITTGIHEIHSRLVLFTIPSAFMLIAVGIIRFSKLSPKPMLVTVLFGVLLMLPLANNMFPWPDFMRQEMRPLVAFLSQRLSPDDTVYVYGASVPAFSFYTRNKPIPYIKGSTVDPAGLSKDLKQVMGGKRIWAIISHDYVKNHMIIKRELEVHHGPVLTEYFPGAWLLLSAD